MAVSLVSLVEKDCKLEMISPVANLTGGNIVRVDPEKLDTQFKEFMKETIVATNVIVSIRVHKAIEFANVQNGVINGPQLVCDIGNATPNTELTFEYKLKKLELLKKIPNFDV